MSKNIPWSRPDIGQEERDAVQRVMESGWVTCGPETKKFEEELASYLGCRHVVAVNNGTSALLAALLVHEVKQIILPTYAYHATVAAARTLGIEVLFQDIDERTIQMNPSFAQYSVPISFAGLPLDAEAWTHPEDVIEDAAESFGAESRRVKTGAQGWTATFSFHAAKTITTIEGGAVATNDNEIYVKLLEVRSKVLNFKPTDISSAIGRVQLKKVDLYLDQRKAVADLYREVLEGYVLFQQIPDHVTRHANMMFPIFVDEPWRLAFKLKNDGVETRVGWKPALETPISAKVSREIITIPIFNLMRVEEAEYVAECVKKSL